MKKSSNVSIEKHFGKLIDPKIETRNKRHEFLDIIIISICAVICGADGWVAIESFGKAKEDWFKTFLKLPNGIPSHDTFGDIFSKLEPSGFQDCFISWTSNISELVSKEIVAFDGKTLRRSHDKSNSKSAIHMVSAWASTNSLVLGQLKTEEKSNEITAIPELLKVLELKGCLITIDAMGCQTKIASNIIDKEADYLLAVKENQPNLYESIVNYFEEANSKSFEGYSVSYAEIKDKPNHGRLETRRCWVSDTIDFIPNKEKWKNLSSIVMIESERHVKGEVSIEHRYYISSCSEKPEFLLNATRKHWSIENSLHWVLDMAFREDESRIRKDHAPENFSVLRHIALNLLKNEKSVKLGIQNKRLKAGWDMSFLKKVLKLLDK